MQLEDNCVASLSHLDSLIGIIEPEMPQQIERWGGNIQEWQDNVQELRDYILERCSDVIISGMEDCYDVEAITLNVIIEGDGEVQINSIDLDPGNTPWGGTYYSGVPIEIQATPYELVNFYWEIIDGDAIIANVTDLETTLSMLSGPVTLVANFDACALIESDLIIGPDEVEEGQISQYTFFGGEQNELEWEITGGEILWTSGFDNTIAVQWDYGVDEGVIVLGAANELGELLCYTTTITINDATTIIGLNENNDGVLVVFPNPFTNNIKIVSSEQVSSFVVQDQLGRVVYEAESLAFEGLAPNVLNLDFLNTGIYFLFINTAENTYIKTIKKT